MRPLGRAPKLTVRLPPWHTVGQHRSILKQAYGGLWAVQESSNDLHEVFQTAGSAPVVKQQCLKAVQSEQAPSDLAHTNASRSSMEQEVHEAEEADTCAIEGGSQREEGMNASATVGEYGIEQCIHAVRSSCTIAPSLDAASALGGRLHAAQAGYHSAWHEFETSRDMAGCSSSATLNMPSLSLPAVLISVSSGLPSSPMRSVLLRSGRCFRRWCFCCPQLHTCCSRPCRTRKTKSHLVPFCSADVLQALHSSESVQSTRHAASQSLFIPYFAILVVSCNTEISNATCRHCCWASGHYGPNVTECGARCYGHACIWLLARAI
jgi:hypothetical protein